jgi:hypothetical protein
MIAQSPLAHVRMTDSWKLRRKWMKHFCDNDEGKKKVMREEEKAKKNFTRDRQRVGKYLWRRGNFF